MQTLSAALTDTDLADEIPESLSSEHHPEDDIGVLEPTGGLYTTSSPLTVEVVDVTQVRVGQYL